MPSPVDPHETHSALVRSDSSRLRVLCSRLRRAAAITPDTEIIHQLFLLNISLQLFDGVATYYGIRHPLHEANPVLGFAMAQIGIGAALLVSKATACAGLVVLRSLAGRIVALRALTAVAATYTCLSFIPWTAWNFSRLYHGYA